MYAVYVLAVAPGIVTASLLHAYEIPVPEMPASNVADVSLQSATSSPNETVPNVAVTVTASFVVHPLPLVS